MQAVFRPSRDFDLERDLYGTTLAIECVERLRDEQRFASVEALVRQPRAGKKRAGAIDRIGRGTETHGILAAGWIDQRQGQMEDRFFAAG